MSPPSGGTPLPRETGGAFETTAVFETGGAVGEADVEIFEAAVWVGWTVGLAIAFLFSACEQPMASAAMSIEAVTDKWL